MKRYGLLRPAMKTANVVLRRGGRIVRSLYQQRRLQVGNDVTIAHNVSFFGGGAVVLGDHVEVGAGVVFKVDEGSTVEIGANSYIGEGSKLEARRGQILRFGRHFKLGERCSIVSIRGIFWGDYGSLGSESQVSPREDGVEGSMVVGTSASLHSRTLIDLSADVTIGDSVRSGPYCAFYTHNHVPMVGKLIWEQSPRCAPISVGFGAWIGHNCCILPGVSIGDNSVIATGAVVTKSVESWTVVGGIPARPLKRLMD
jgi:acetyltransferase-like isoleucine patch superfamily enzyme